MSDTLTAGKVCPKGETFDRITKRCRAKKTPGRKPHTTYYQHWPGQTRVSDEVYKRSSPKNLKKLEKEGKMAERQQIIEDLMKESGFFKQFKSPRRRS